VDDAARAEIYKQVQQQIFDEAHDIILWFRNGTIGRSPMSWGWIRSCIRTGRT
jgi:hypothetical protein